MRPPLKLSPIALALVQLIHDLRIERWLAMRAAARAAKAATEGKGG